MYSTRYLETSDQGMMCCAVTAVKLQDDDDIFGDATDNFEDTFFLMIYDLNVTSVFEAHHGHNMRSLLLFVCFNRNGVPHRREQTFEHWRITSKLQYVNPLCFMCRPNESF